jgi:hypothetical protein
MSSNYNYQDIESATENFAIRRNRYISVLTAVICLTIISFLVVINNKSSDTTFDITNKYKEVNLIEETVVPATSKPTRKPTEAPTFDPTVSPTSIPTSKPTLSPTKKPTHSPTTKPSTTPTVSPTSQPTVHVTPSPSSIPTRNPTPFPISPTDFPTKAPRNHPTHPPTKNPRPNPTQQPTKTPHGVPSKKPTDWSNTYHPTLTPIFVPTTPPTKSPVYEKTNRPTKSPRFPPTHAPQPTRTPTTYNCIDSFTNDLNKDILNFYVDNPTGTASYTTVHGTYSVGGGFNFPVWCMDYFTPIASNFVYNETVVLTWTDITSDPSLHQL